MYHTIVASDESRREKKGLYKVFSRRKHQGADCGESGESSGEGEESLSVTPDLSCDFQGGREGEKKGEERAKKNKWDRGKKKKENMLRTYHFYDTCRRSRVVSYAGTGCQIVRAQQ